MSDRRKWSRRALKAGTIGPGDHRKANRRDGIDRRLQVDRRDQPRPMRVERRTS